jgi:hypothetical protein
MRRFDRVARNAKDQSITRHGEDAVMSAYPSEKFAARVLDAATSIVAEHDDDGEASPVLVAAVMSAIVEFHKHEWAQQ